MEFKKHRMMTGGRCNRRTCCFPVHMLAAHGVHEPSLTAFAVPVGKCHAVRVSLMSPDVSCAFVRCHTVVGQEIE